MNGYRECAGSLGYAELSPLEIILKMTELPLGMKLWHFFRRANVLIYLGSHIQISHYMELQNIWLYIYYFHQCKFYSIKVDAGLIPRKFNWQASKRYRNQNALFSLYMSDLNYLCEGIFHVNFFFDHFTARFFVILVKK